MCGGLSNKFSIYLQFMFDSTSRLIYMFSYFVVYVENNGYGLYFM